MLKKRILSVIIGLVLLTAVAGSTGIVGDAVELSITASAYACSNGSSTGGGC